MTFTGKLTVESDDNTQIIAILAIQGELDTKTGYISFQKTKILTGISSGDQAWALGINQGTKSTESRLGNGSDSR